MKKQAILTVFLFKIREHLNGDQKTVFLSGSESLRSKVTNAADAIALVNKGAKIRSIATTKVTSKNCTLAFLSGHCFLLLLVEQGFFALSFDSDLPCGKPRERFVTCDSRKASSG